MTYKIIRKHKNNESLSSYWGMVAIVKIGLFVIILEHLSVLSFLENWK